MVAMPCFISIIPLCALPGRAAVFRAGFQSGGRRRTFPSIADKASQTECKLTDKL
jgi:hypothetical protein